MTDREIAASIETAQQTEQQARRAWEAAAARRDLPESDAALIVVRHATATRKALETWLAVRARRAALHS